MTSLRMEQSLRGHGRSISALRFSPDGRYLATADMAVCVWEVAEAEAREGQQEQEQQQQQQQEQSQPQRQGRQQLNLVATLRGHTRGISDISWSPDSQHLASASDDCTVLIWSPFQSSDPLRTLSGHTNYVFCVDWGPTALLATGSFDESVRLWNVRSGECLKAVSAHGDPVTGVSFGPDGTILASSSYDGLIRIWDAATGNCLKTIVDDDNPPVSAIRFSVNGKFLLAATLDSTIRLWSLTTDKCVKSYTGHVNRRYCIVPSFISIPTEDERSGADVHIIAGSEDGRIVIWNLNSRAVVLEQQCHKGAVMAVAVHPTKRLLATASLEPDTSINIYSF